MDTDAITFRCRRCAEGRLTGPVAPAILRLLPGGGRWAVWTREPGRVPRADADLSGEHTRTEWTQLTAGEPGASSQSVGQRMYLRCHRGHRVQLTLRQAFRLADEAAHLGTEVVLVPPREVGHVVGHSYRTTPARMRRPLLKNP